MLNLKFDLDNPAYEYIVSQKRAQEVLELLDKEKVLAVDVEANSLDPYVGTLILVQISTSTISYIFDARAVSLKDIPLYKKIIEDKNKIKLLHNGKFDYGYIKLHTDAKLANIFDTMLAEGVLTAGYNPKLGLGAVAEKYLQTRKIDKSLQSSFVRMTKNQKITEEQLRYAGIDTLILFPIFEEQLKLLNKENLMNIAKLEFAATAVVAEMELRGVHIDTIKWREIIRNLEIKRDEAAAAFLDAVKPYYPTNQLNLFGESSDVLNINSNAQLMDLFNKRLNLNLPNTNNNVLTSIDHPIVKLLTTYRGYEKIVSTYGEKLLARINPVTKRIHPEFLQIRTATGRFACNNPNLQNIPRNSEEAPFRTCFNPAEGYKLVVSDYSSFEMRILADLSGDQNMIKALNEGLDIHSFTASLMFDKPYTPTFKKEWPELRQMAKPIGFGLMYGMGAQGLVTRIFQETSKMISLEESQGLIDKYFKGYPGVKDFLERSAREAQLKGYSTTPAGRKRWYEIPDRTDPDYKRKMSSIGREAKNHPIQGTNADAIKYALVFIQDRIKNEGIDGGIISTVHDEIVCEVRNDQAEDFAKVLQSEMIRAGELFLKKVKVVSDPFVGDVWEH